MPKRKSLIDDDNPPLTKADFARMRPFSEAEPELARAIKTRGPQKTPTKIATTIRLDPEVVAFFKARGKGWQSRINDVLRAVVESAR